MEISEFIKLALLEDVGPGDYTTLACIPESATNTANLIAREDGVVAGVDIAKMVFREVDPSLQITIHKFDGETVSTGDLIFEIAGSSRAILTAERLALNFMQRMSGIATHTRYLCDKISEYDCQLLDTRKTTPGFRYFEKLAVKIGGGTNHRFGLYDMIMIKDNHIDFAGGITEALDATDKYLNAHELDLYIVVEARDMAEVKEILSDGRANRILLDNFTPELMKEAVELVNHKMQTEASGGISENTIASYASTGVDYISVGALTHQIKSLDLSLVAQ